MLSVRYWNLCSNSELSQVVVNEPPTRSEEIPACSSTTTDMYQVTRASNQRQGPALTDPRNLPDEVDVLIVGSGPAGMLTAAQLAQFPGITTRLVERRDGRLAIGQADGIQARSVETFQAFGFAERIIAEAYRITEMAFWRPDTQNPTHIVRGGRAMDDADRHQRVPAPDRQPGTRARLLCRSRGILAQPA